MKDKLLVIALIFIVIAFSGCASLPSIQIPGLWGQPQPTIHPSEQFNAVVINETIPTTMLPGKFYNFSITMKNTGNISWSDTDYIALASSDDTVSDTLLFNNSTFTIAPGSIVKTGSEYTWYVIAKAPQWVGNYTISYRMLNNDTYFGSSAPRNVIVGDLNSTVVFLTKGEIYYPALTNMEIKKDITTQNVSITVKNMGRYDWTADNVSLQVVDYEPNSDTLLNPALTYHLAPESVISPGDQCTWKFKLNVPSETGTYTLKYRMQVDGQWFGKMLTANITVI